MAVMPGTTTASGKWQTCGAIKGGVVRCGTAMVVKPDVWAISFQQSGGMKHLLPAGMARPMLLAATHTARALGCSLRNTGYDL